MGLSGYDFSAFGLTIRLLVIVKDIDNDCKGEWKSLWLEELKIMLLFHVFTNLFVAGQEALEI